MPTMNDGGIMRPADKNYSVKNKSGSHTKPEVPGSKNKGSQNIEAKATGNVRRARGGSQYDNYGVTRSRNKGSYNGDMRQDFKPKVPSGKNKGSAPDHPDVSISSGKTKVHNYPAGRNRGRNFKG